MSYEFYKIVHLTGIVLLFSGLIGLLTVQMSQGQLIGKTRKLVFITHGVGLLLLLISGFGQAAKLGILKEFPGWVYGKIVIWLILGAAVSLAKRKGAQFGWPLYILFLIIFIVAAYLAIGKPF